MNAGCSLQPTRYQLNRHRSYDRRGLPMLQLSSSARGKAQEDGLQMGCGAREVGVLRTGADLELDWLSSTRNAVKGQIYTKDHS